MWDENSMTGVQYPVSAKNDVMFVDLWKVNFTSGLLLDKQRAIEEIFIT